MAAFQVVFDDANRPRIAKVENGYRRDVCGAVDLGVALAQVEILNRREARRAEETI